LPEVIQDAGLLFEPKDVDGFAAAIKKILADKAYADTLVARGFAHVTHFSWQTVAQKTMDLYEELANE
jgi:alpha-1,3-rhamnosyl/mannosyltransferase